MAAFNNRCVVLYSGGLDSLLAVAIMKNLGFDVLPLFVQTPFYNKNIDHLKKQLEQFSLELYIKRDDQDYIDMLKNPQFGYGKNLNPCIDCKIFFYRQAFMLMEESGASFAVTGEVLGQRPMSQRSYSVLRNIEKRANLTDRVLRVLSAKCLPDTLMEKEGIINKNKLFCITGRSRKEQFQLADHFGIDEFESPAGGCLLTDKTMALRIKDMIKSDNIKDIELELLNIGRHFKINSKRFIVSRKKAETAALFDRFKDVLPIIKCHNAPGAVGVFIDNPDKQDIEIAGSIIKYYSKKAESVEYQLPNKEVYVFYPETLSLDEINLFKIV
jgi:tRNA-specific 2-thiouridylase